ncbi:hydroxypyruvate isomerase family protein [Massilia sp. PAMC28688]|uniref:2-oxo-tetronate isomerase n=1 Tax=Massilia sp. PAMC28688 TaxID=2861283 RepID=UPI001C625F79|nr:2-oxo-tetronate isomerase [Massilia sp. PAMC28688]QYF93802.1 hydroxypyruvate isomerase family protein [Massilia sp. PAMC28688]
MPKFAANLSLMFAHLDFPDRVKAARDCGFKAVECLFPYAWPAEVLAAALREHGLALVLHNLPPGDWDKGERGMACDPARGDEFRAGVAMAAQYANALGVKRLHCLAGLLPPGVTPQAARACYIENLRHAARVLAPDGMALLIEPINTFDMPGYFLTGSDQAADIIAACAEPNLFMQFDMYHLQRMGEDVGAALRRHLPLIGHMQLADVPGRHEPGTGEMDYPALFQLIDALGYDGWIGCEYHPLGDTAAGLRWLRKCQP